MQSGPTLRKLKNLTHYPTMKYPGHIHSTFIAASAAFVCVAPIQASAQSLQEVMPKGIKAMKEGKFAEAQQTFSDFTSNFGMERGERLFGGYFGSAYYYQGRTIWTYNLQKKCIQLKKH